MDGDMQYQDLSTNDYNSRLPIRQAQEEFKYYFYYVIFKRKWLIINIFILGMITTVLGLYLITPLYKGSSKLLVRSNISQEVILFNDLYSHSATMSKTIPANNFIEIATSHVIARIMVEKFKLDQKLKDKIEHPENFREEVKAFIEKAMDKLKYAVKYPYNLYQEHATGQFPPEEKKDYTSRAIKKFMEDITEIELVQESDIIYLAIWDESPQKCEAMVKTLTKLVIEQSVAMEQDAAGYGYEFAKKEMVKARDELVMAEQQAQEFKNKWGISNIEIQKEIKLNELDMVEKELISINSMLHSFKAKLSEGKKQLSQQKKSLGSLQAHRDLQNESIRLEVEISAFEAQKKHYKGTETRIRKEIRSLVDKEAELNRFMREVGMKKDLFDQLGKKYGELNIQSVSNLGGFDLRVIDMPELRNDMKPHYPVWNLGLGLGVTASMILSLILAFFLELQNESFWIGNQVENKLGIPLLGSIKFYHDSIKP